MTQQLTPICLPSQSAAQTEHSTEHCRRIAEDNLILLSPTGSHLHGIATADSDRDFMGVCIEPPDVKLGFTRFSMYEYQSFPQHARAEAGDVEVTIHGLNKWVKLLAGGDPNAILPLFTPYTQLITCLPAALRIREAAHLFATQAAGVKFSNYVTHNRGDLVKQYEHKVDKPKYQSHVARIALQGIELMNTGAITLPLSDDNRTLMHRIRSRAISHDETLCIIAELDAQLQRDVDNTPLPQWPNYDTITALLIEIYSEWWATNPYASFETSSRSHQRRNPPTEDSLNWIHSSTP